MQRGQTGGVGAVDEPGVLVGEEGLKKEAMLSHPPSHRKTHALQWTRQSSQGKLVG